MVAFSVKMMLGVGMMLSSALIPAFSATVVNGGVIHFRGMIVENPCEITPQKQKFALSCPKDGQMQTTQVSYQDAISGRNVNPDTARVSMKYLNPEKSLAVVQIDYR